jgi:hypothetical protein
MQALNRILYLHLFCALKAHGADKGGMKHFTAGIYEGGPYDESP